MKITITPGIEGRKLNESELMDLVSYLILTPENSATELKNWVESGKRLANYKGYNPKIEGDNIVILGPSINPYHIFDRIIEENKDMNKPRYSIMHSKVEYEEWPSIPHWEEVA